jgi:predicted amidophosphoribosyltransferase
MYLCDICGFSREKPGLCPHCDLPLSEYSKETQKEYQVDMEEPMRSVSEYKWYI